MTLLVTFGFRGLVKVITLGSVQSCSSEVVLIKKHNSEKKADCSSPHTIIMIIKER